MRWYKNYLVVEYANEDSIFAMNQEWTVATFSDYESAFSFLNAYIPAAAYKVEIQGTDEDIDVCVDIHTVCIKDIESGKIVNLQELTETDPRILTIARDENLWDEGREGEEGVNANIVALSTLSGCYDIIEHLIETINDISNN